ncbi:MAG: DNA topoisomerase (ATP-hydrolyzing) subunit A [Candidatus Dasytiphilus stammeri]
MSNLTSSSEIVPINIEEELESSYIDYAMSVIVGRALPDIRDGLKPVHRRVLYAMYILGNNWNKPYKKSARIVGDVIGKYHPHGDIAVYDALVRMAQSFSLRYILVDGQGNFGSIDGDPAAAMRYTEVRMTKIAHELLADLEKETVKFVPNYDGNEHIPEVFPTKIPNLLINGCSGIAVGMATNIPPHNLSEIINGCLAYINDNNISIKELMKYIPGPDFPTAAIINGTNGIEKAYHTGRGKIDIRARCKIQQDAKTGRETIICYEIPYQVNKARLIEKIADLIKEKRIEGINTLRDESDKDGMRIFIEIKKDFMAEVILNHLYNLTPLQISFHMNMVALHDGKPQLLSLKDMIAAFIDHRREVVIRRTIYDLKKKSNSAHILEGLAIALVNIDRIIEIIRKSKNIIEAKSILLSQSWEFGDLSLIIQNYLKIKSHLEISSNEPKISGIYDKKYYFSQEQTQAILDLRLNKLTSLEHKNLLDEYNYLLKEIQHLSHVLQHSEQLMKVICKELIEIRDQFHDERSTEIITKSVDITIEDLIINVPVVVTLSHLGYVKYQPLSEYEAQHRGGKGKLATSIKKGQDYIERLLVANSHDSILCFSSVGRLYWLKVYQLPESNRYSKGRPIVNILPLISNERITAILPVHDNISGKHVFMATAKGLVKKTPLIELNKPRNAGIIAINLNEGDELIGVNFTDGTNDVMLFSAAGKVVRFNEQSVRSMGRTSAGVRGIKLSSSITDRVVSLIVPQNKGEILTVTKNGYGKRTAIDEYPLKSRSTQGVISIKVTKRNGNVVGAVQVNSGDEIMIITDAGTLVRTRVLEVSIVGRNTQGVVLIRTSLNEHVVALQRIVEPTTIMIK